VAIERQQQILYVEPDMVPALRAAFQSAIAQVNEALVGLSRRGFLPMPWLGDEESREVAAHYTQQAMEGPASSYQALVAYHRELNTVHDTLQRMEDEYRRRDDDASTDFGRRA
jgi:hypothetical protein